jgi:hypothetical protein
LQEEDKNMKSFYVRPREEIGALFLMSEKQVFRENIASKNFPTINSTNKV